MCAGCDAPNCGGACGTGDWEKEEKWAGSLTCSNCDTTQEVDVIATVTGNSDGGCALLYFDWICNSCDKMNEYEEDYEGEEDYDYFDDFED